MVIQEEDPVKLYIETFIQSSPTVVIKPCRKNATWVTIKVSVSRRLVEQHLNQKIWVGTRGAHYPRFGIIDIDGQRGIERAHEIASQLEFTPENSMLCYSETPENFHLLFRPLYSGNPPTLSLFTKIMSHRAAYFDCESYPQKSRFIRLPFGNKQRSCRRGEESLNWEQLLAKFLQLEPYEMVTALEIFKERTFGITRKQIPKSQAAKEGRELLETGLIINSSRHDSQFLVLYYYFQGQVPQWKAIELTYAWIRNNHNGHSKLANQNRWDEIKKDIIHQANHIWDKYTRYTFSAQFTRNGFVSREDLTHIICLTKGQSSRMKFLYSLIKYWKSLGAPDEEIAIHSELLIQWSSRNSYQSRLNELINAGVIVRDERYAPTIQSKKVKINWPKIEPRSDEQSEKQSPPEYEGAIRSAFTEKELLTLLRSIGVAGNARNRIAAKIYQ